MFLCEIKVVMNKLYFNMTVLAELSYLLAGLIAIIGALRVYYLMSHADEMAAKVTIFSTVGFSFLFLVLGFMAAMIWKA